jgi:hypothetical protein
MRFMKHKTSHSTQAKSDKEENYNGDMDPVIVKKLFAHTRRWQRK